MTIRAGLLASILAAASTGAVADDYIGVLSLPRTTLPAAGAFYSFAALPPPSLAGAAQNADQAFRLKLGYQYSRYFSVEGELNDLARLPANLFGAPDGTASAFRSSGFGIDTVATLPLAGFSFYGKMGAYRGESRGDFAMYSTSLLGDASQRTRWRYGLGVRYDFTRSLGVRAELEHYSPLGAPLAAEADGDLVSIGVSWRF
jgi:opacity protein-like surface antigen